MKGETTRKKTADRRMEILDAALNIVWEDGVHALSMRSLSEKVGVSEAALYRHFEGKADIVAELVDLAFGSGDGLTRSTMGADWFLANMQARLACFEADPRLIAVLFHEEAFRAFPEAGSRFDRRRREAAEGIEKKVIELQSSGLALGTDPTIFAIVYMGSMRMLVMEWDRAGRVDALAEKADALMRELGKLLR